MNKEIVNAAVDYNAAALHIKPPKIVYRPSAAFSTATTIAAASQDGKSIAINSDDARLIDPRLVWFAVSHELRHIWQIVNGVDFSGYTVASGLSIEDYNAQEAEIDAHAWAIAVMSCKFGIRPTLEKQLGAALWRRIEQRSKDIEL